MNKIITIKAAAIISGALLITSCSNSDNTDDWNNEIRLSSGLSVQEGTRAGTDVFNKVFSGNEEIDVYINESVETGETATSTYDQPLVYTASSPSNNINSLTPPPDEQPYWPSSGNGVDIYAVYPSGTASGSDFTVKTEQSDADNYKKSDLMYASTSSKRTSSAVNIAFTHKLCKVTIILKSGAGSPSLAGASVDLLDVYPSATVKFDKDNFEISTQNGEGIRTSDINVIKNGTTEEIQDGDSKITVVQGSCIVPPQTLKEEFVKVTLKSGGVLYGKLASDTPTLASGKVYTYTITVNLTGLELTGSISDWDNGESKDGNATMRAGE